MLTRSAHAGFTLVELMVTVAIAGILLSLAFPSFKAWMQNTKIRAVAESIQNGLQLARTEAVRRNTRVQLIGSEGGGWTVGCFNAVPDENGDGVDDCPKVIQQRNAAELGSSLPQVIASPADTTTVTFDGLGRVRPTNKDGSLPVEWVDVDAPTGTITAAESRELRILISSGGQIRTCEPALPATDPRGC